MEKLTIALGIAAALVHGAAYILYNVHAKLGKSSPNVTTWSIWALFAIINTLSYYEMSGDAVVTLQFFTGSVACIFTFFYTLTIGKFSWPGKKDWGCFFLVLIAILVWWKFESVTGANMIFVIAFIISFIPTYIGVLRDPLKEMPMSWALWSIAYIITTTNVVLRDDGHMALVMPFVLAIAHGSIVGLSTKSRKERVSNVRL
ncbi:MAG: hypothetical protein Q8P20_01575 [bacterium]|nr:hypothetical protein [bacterium]